MSPSRPGEYALAAARAIREQPTMGASVRGAARTFDGNRAAAWQEIEADAWRDWARDVKRHALTHLHRYLEEAEARLLAHGACVHWAEDAAEAQDIVGRILLRHGVRRIVKAKSMLTEELDLNRYLEGRGAQVRETDLGEYILQLLGQPPSHIIAPAIHLGLEDCRRLFAERLGTPADASPQALAAAARTALRADFLAADLGISGANFVAADTGTLALIENEGNIRLSTSAPRVHVALVGIEKVVPRLEDLSGFLQIVSRSATGQAIGNYVSLVSGPRRAQDPDGPEAFYVVFVDNGRTRILFDDVSWETLSCVRCGACANICPVYRQTGGHAYGFTYPGPIGAILAPGLLGLENAMPLPYASSLCGACADVCPVRIPIPRLLLYWRERAVEAGLLPATERIAMRAFAATAAHSRVFASAGALLRWVPWTAGGRALPVLGAWAGERTAPEPSQRSFRHLWKKGIR